MSDKPDAQPTPRTDEETSREQLASRLIDAWCAEHGKITWAKAVQIIAIVTQQSDEERARLLRMGDEDGSCGMCGRNAINLERALAQKDTELAAANEGWADAITQWRTDRTARERAERNNAISVDLVYQHEARANNAEQRLAAVEAALRELVTLKDMKDGFGQPPFGTHNSAAALAEYAQRKPIAWENARAALTAAPKEPAPVAQEPVAWVRMRHGEIDWSEDCLFASKSDSDEWGYEEDEGVTIVPLYASPQAPVVQDAALKELGNIANAKRFDRECFDDDSSFADWAQSRARFILDAARAGKREGEGE